VIRPGSAQCEFRGLSANDCDLFVGLYTCPVVMRHIAEPLTEAQANVAFQSALRHQAAALPGHRHWTVWSPDAVGLVTLRRASAHAEFGLMLLPRAWDGALSARCVRWALDHAFTEMRVERVLADCRIGANARVAARLLRPHAATVEAGARDGCVRRVVRRPDALESNPHSAS